MTAGTWTAEIFLAALLLMAAQPLKRLWRGEWKPWQHTRPPWPLGYRPGKRWVRTWPVAYCALLLGVLTMPAAQLSAALGAVLGCLALLAILLGIAIFVASRPKKLIPPALR
jgi:hypothetical protein